MGHSEQNVALVRLSYVGLPLAVAFGKTMPTIGYDLSEKKVANYRNQCDPTNELALIFDLLGIDTLEVLEAAGTKATSSPS